MWNAQKTCLADKLYVTLESKLSATAENFQTLIQGKVYREKQKYESEELGGCGKGADCVSQKQVKLFRDENLKDMFSEFEGNT